MKKIAVISLLLLLISSNIQAISFTTGAKLVGGSICCVYSAHSLFKTAVLVNYLRNTAPNDLPRTFTQQSASKLETEVEGVTSLAAAPILLAVAPAVLLTVLNRIDMAGDTIMYALKGTGSGLLGAWLLKSGLKDLSRNQ